MNQKVGLLRSDIGFLLGLIFISLTVHAEEVPTPPVLQSKRCQFGANAPKDGFWALSASAQTIEIYMRGSDLLQRILVNDVDDRNISSCVFLDGQPRLAALLLGYEYYFKRTQDWNRSFEPVKSMKDKFPHSAATILAEAEYWFTYAWNARGHGYSSTVTAEGARLFQERLQNAIRVLEEGREYASSNPVWYEAMLSAKSAQGVPERERDAILLEGVRKFNWYLPIYSTRANYLAPWWGGSWDAVDNFANWSVEQTKSLMGNTMYARIYLGVSESDPIKNIFHDTKAQWPRMKAGFDDWVRHYPDSKWNLNNYARFACDAGDKEIFLTLRKQLASEKAIDRAAWDKTRIEVCDAKFNFVN